MTETPTISQPDESDLSPNLKPPDAQTVLPTCICRPAGFWVLRCTALKQPPCKNQSSFISHILPAYAPENKLDLSQRVRVKMCHMLLSLPGSCHCGSCLCDDADKKGLVTGRYCECDDSECLDEETAEVCGGRSPELCLTVTDT